MARECDYNDQNQVSDQYLLGAAHASRVHLSCVCCHHIVLRGHLQSTSWHAGAVHGN